MTRLYPTNNTLKIILIILFKIIFSGVKLIDKAIKELDMSIASSITVSCKAFRTAHQIKAQLIQSEMEEQEAEAGAEEEEEEEEGGEKEAEEEEEEEIVGVIHSKTS